MTDLFFEQFCQRFSSSTENKQNALAIYIHWPWCLHKCPYCDFNSHVLSNAPTSDYVNCLLTELFTWKEKLGNRHIESVFFGGGTPSLINPTHIKDIITRIDELFGLTKQTEITVECNPTSSSKSLFTGLKLAGVNRISIGVQGLNEKTLRFLGRQHDEMQALETILNACELFNNVSADVIYGLPDQNLATWKNELTTLASMELSHLSAYQLTIEPNTAFYSQVARGQWEPLPDDFQADFYHATQEILEGFGFEAYEISNHAKPEKQCQHNVHVWQYHDYIGVGAGAHGRIVAADENGLLRRQATSNRKDPLAYIKRIHEGMSPVTTSYILNDEEALQEAFLMGFRLVDGVDAANLIKTIHKDAWLKAFDLRKLDQLIQQNVLECKMTQLRVNPEYRLLTNSILKQIFT